MMSAIFHLEFEEKHYNRNCGCTIPAAWVAYVTDCGVGLPKWPCGDTKAEARANVLREFPNAKESA